MSDLRFPPQVWGRLGADAKTPTGLFVVMVTYGNRFKNMALVISAVLVDPRVIRIILVDNNSDPESSRRIQRLGAAGSGKIRVMRNEVNLGSAGGFKQGILAAVNDESCTHVWLLDDDNMPLTNCLSELISGWNKLLSKYDEERLCLASFRHSREIYRRIALRGQNARSILIGEENSFRGYHIKNIFQYLWGKLTIAPRESKSMAASDSGELLINLAPWGGMFFSRALVEFVGPPNESLYLCMDDWEFSNRLISRGGKIILIAGAGIQDLDEDSIEPRSGMTKYYYGTRNHIWFSKQFLKTNSAIYFLSRCLCMLIAWVKLCCGSSRERWGVFLLAFRDAEAGAMGKKDYAFLSK